MYEQFRIDFNDDLDDSEIYSRVDIFFSKNGSISLCTDEEIAFHVCIILYNMNKLRMQGNEKFMFVGFIEELVHHFGRIDDETTVKEKVVQIAQKYYSDITIETLRKWGVLGA